MSHKDDGGSRRRTVLQGVGAMLGVGALASTAGADEHGSDDHTGGESDENGESHESDGTGQFCLPAEGGLVTVDGGESVEETVAAIEGAIEDAAPMLIAKVDHAENAASVGEELRPTTLLLFGNPNAGTPLMQENQVTGIDLPQKILVWCDEDTNTNVTYNDPEYLAARHGLEENDELIEMIGTALETLAESGRDGSGEDNGAGKNGDEQA